MLLVDVHRATLDADEPQLCTQDAVVRDRLSGDSASACWGPTIANDDSLFKIPGRLVGGRAPRNGTPDAAEHPCLQGTSEQRGVRPNRLGIGQPHTHATLIERNMRQRHVQRREPLTHYMHMGVRVWGAILTMRAHRKPAGRPAVLLPRAGRLEGFAAMGARMRAHAYCRAIVRCPSSPW